MQKPFMYYDAEKTVPSTLLLYLCYGFFFKTLFLFVVIVTATMMSSPIVIMDV